MFHDVPVCPCCSGHDSESPGSFTWEGHAIPLLVCNTCGAARLGKSLTKDALRIYYKNNSVYYGHEEGSRKSKQVREYRAFLEPFLCEADKKSLTVLDVGCGFGEFLSTFTGWRKLGVELNPERAAYARNYYGIEVLEDDFSILLLPEKSIFLATATSVLEHSPEPIPFLKKCSDALTDDGLLFVSVPDIAHRHPGLTGQFSIEHILYFTQETFILFLSSLGFTIKGCITHGVDFKNTGVLLGKSRYESMMPVLEHGRALADKIIVILKEQLANIMRTRENISNIFDKFNIYEKTGSVSIYGSGNHTKLLMQHFPQLRDVKIFFDSDPKKWGTSFIRGRVYSPSELQHYKPKFLIYSSEIHSSAMHKHATQYLDASTTPVFLYE